MAKRGAKCKLTPQRRAKIYKCLEDGLTDKATCAICGINQDTFYCWIKEKSEFSEAVHKKRQSAEQELYNELKEIATQKIPLSELTMKDRQAIVPLINTKARTLEWMLTHRYSDSYAERVIQEERTEQKDPYTIMIEAIDSGGKDEDENEDD